MAELNGGVGAFRRATKSRKIYALNNGVESFRYMTYQRPCKSLSEAKYEAKHQARVLLQFLDDLGIGSWI